MKSLIIFICLQGFVINLFSQNEYLILTYVKHPRIIKKIPEGNRVKIQSISGDKGKIKGRLEIISDSAIVVGSDSIFLNNIKKITVKRTVTNIAGPVAAGAGVGVAIWGMNMISASFEENELLGIFVFFFAGAPLVASGIGFTIGGIILFNGISYKTYGEHYSIKIVNGHNDSPNK
jgi:hypothetical protein